MFKIQTKNLSNPIQFKYVNNPKVKNTLKTSKRVICSSESISVFFPSADFIPQVSFLSCIFPVLYAGIAVLEDFREAVSSSLHQHF